MMGVQFVEFLNGCIPLSSREHFWKNVAAL